VRQAGRHQRAAQAAGRTSAPAAVARLPVGDSVRDDSIVRCAALHRALAVCICAAVIGAAGASRAAESTDAATTVNPWATGGVPGVPKPADGTQGPMAYWQAPALPQAVIAGGAIPAGWTPQAVPYTGVGPDGKPLTMYYAPTYVFTYQVGPPVIAAAAAPAAQVNRRQAMLAPQPVAMQGWNYQTQGVPAPAYALPPATVARYQPVPYQYPPGAQQLSGTPIVPPAGLPPAPVAPVAPPVYQQPAAPPSQWVPVPQQQPVAPPQWGPSAEPPPALVPQPAAAPDPSVDAFAAAAPPIVAGTAGAIAAQQQQPQQPMVTPIGSPAAGVPATPASSAGAASRPGSTHLWRVVGVHDGDTITCLDESNQQQKVRLSSIDAPEIGQEYGKVARENLAAMIFGKTVEVVDEGKDRYGRWVGRVFCNGQDVNRDMIASGNAWHFAEYSNDASLAALQQQAQQQRAGLWATSNPTPPWDYRDQMKRPST
jgi:micrococcal nuclease